MKYEYILKSKMTFLTHFLYSCLLLHVQYSGWKEKTDCIHTLLKNYTGHGTLAMELCAILVLQDCIVL